MHFPLARGTFSILGLEVPSVQKLEDSGAKINSKTAQCVQPHMEHSEINETDPHGWPQMRSLAVGWTSWLILGFTKAFPGHVPVELATGLGQDFGG